MSRIPRGGAGAYQARKMWVGLRFHTRLTARITAPWYRTRGSCRVPTQVLCPTPAVIPAKPWARTLAVMEVTRRYDTIVTKGARGRVMVPVPFDPGPGHGVPKPQHHVAGTVNGMGVRAVIETTRERPAEVRARSRPGVRDCRAVDPGDTVVAVALDPEGPQRDDLADDLRHRPRGRTSTPARSSTRWPSSIARAYLQVDRQRPSGDRTCGSNASKRSSDYSSRASSSALEP